MATPHQLDLLLRTDALASWVTGWTEPVILRGASSPSPEPKVASSVQRIFQAVVQKFRIIRTHTPRQVVLHFFTQDQHFIDFVFLIPRDNLQWAKDFGQD